MRRHNIEWYGLEINNTNPNFFLTVLKTLPVDPTHVKFIVLSQLKNQNSDRLERQKGEHIDYCLERGIVPFQRVVFEYKAGIESFVEEGIEKKESYTYTIKNHQATRQVIIRPHQFQEVGVRIDPADQGGYQKFVNEGFLDQLIDQGYHIKRGELWLSEKMEGEFPIVRCSDCEVNFDVNSPHNGLEIKNLLHSRVEGKQKVKDWFYKLKKEFSSETPPKE